MTRKDFEIIAEILAIVEKENFFSEKLNLDDCKRKIDSVLLAQNPRYNSDIFWYTVHENFRNEINRVKE